MPCGTDDLVGASLLAKTVFQSMHFRRLCKLFREQARSHRYGVFSSHVDYSHRSAVSRAMRMPCGTDDLVGASLLAKTVFQSMHFRRLCKLFREQARSHRYGVFSGDVKHSHRAGVFSSHVDYSHRSAVFRAMRMPCGTDDLVGASLLAKTVFQSMHFRRLCKLFREQARSHGLRPESRADLCIVSDQRPARDSRM
ncbi:hypothetical protein SAMN05444062_103381 [Pseudomonas syringae]|nr:hypothetical protein SAMN05444062_103381 [Pseudomonas syringae]